MTPEKEMRIAKAAFLNALKSSRSNDDGWTVLSSTLDTAYELGRLRCLNPSLAKEKGFEDDIATLMNDFPNAVKIIKNENHQFCGSMHLEDVYDGLKYCSALQFIKDDFKPLFENAKPDADVLKNFESDWDEAWSMHRYLLHLMTFEWILDRSYGQPDPDEKPCLEGVPDEHTWWNKVIDML